MKWPERTRQSPARRGIATMLVIALIPAVGLFIIVVTDVANLWLAKLELKTAVEAAALSGVKTWGDGGTTAQARDDAEDAFTANTILGNTSTLDTTEGGGANGNGATTEQQLGTITEAGGLLTFDCNQVPLCGRFRARLTVDSADTFQDGTTFRVLFEQVSGSAGTLESVEIDLTPMVVTNPAPPPATIADDGFFDVRPIVGVANDANHGSGPTETTVPAGVTTNFVFSNTVGADQHRTVRVDFTDGLFPAAGDQYIFGIDTDEVGEPAGVADAGGDLGTGGDTIVGATVTFTVSGQTFSQTLTRTGANTSQATVTQTVNSDDRFGVVVEKTVAVTSISSGFLGLTFGPYNITSRATAQYRCPDGPPELVVIDTFNCP